MIKKSLLCCALLASLPLVACSEQSTIIDTHKNKDDVVFNDSRLIYHFKSVETIEQNWSYPSRKESWSEEMKELARKRTNEMNERRKLCQESQ